MSDTQPKEFDLTSPSIERRTLLAAGGLGVAALFASAKPAHAADLTAEEQAALKLVNDFCASWESLDADKIGTFLAEKATFRMIETAPRREGREAIVTGIKAFISTAKSARFEVIRSQVIGNIVINERIDHFDMGTKQNAFHVIGFFWIKDGAIGEWQDYSAGEKK